jgi:hypothetical protein
MRYFNSLRYGLMLAAVVVVTMGAAEDCSGPGNGKATKAAYASDGVTMFVGADNRACSGNTKFCGQEGNGKLRFNQGYKATYIDTTDRGNCRWSLYTINQEGETKVIKSGNYFTANIKVERPSRVKVFLKSSECGNWKPTK